MAFDNKLKQELESDSLNLGYSTYRSTISDIQDFGVGIVLKLNTILTEEIISTINVGIQQLNSLIYTDTTITEITPSIPLFINEINTNSITPVTAVSIPTIIFTILPINYNNNIALGTVIINLRILQDKTSTETTTPNPSLLNKVSPTSLSITTTIGDLKTFITNIIELQKFSSIYVVSQPSLLSRLYAVGISAPLTISN